MLANAPLARGPAAGADLRPRAGVECAARGARVRGVLRAVVLGILVAIEAAPGRSIGMRAPPRGPTQSKRAYASWRTRVKVRGRRCGLDCARGVRGPRRCGSPDTRGSASGR